MTRRGEKAGSFTHGYSDGGGDGYKTCDRPHGSFIPAQASITAMYTPHGTSGGGS